MTVYLEDAQFIDWRSFEITRGHWAIEPGDAGGMLRVESIPADGERVPCAGRFATRAFVIGHHHIYSTLARGMPPPARTPRSFNEILALIWWNLDTKLDASMIRASARAAALEAARCGCTFIIDHHASPSAIEGSLEIIADACEEVGLSHLLCYELSDRDGPDAAAAGLVETERHLHAAPGLVGLHASFTVSDALLERAVDLARRHDTGVHVHVAEAPSDGAHCRKTYGCSLAERFERAGALALSPTILAHALHLDDDDRAIVADSAAWVVHNTQSNQNNGVGEFDPRGLGDRIFIGTDGMHSDMPAAARAMYLEGQSNGGLSPLDAYRRMRRVHAYLHANEIPGDGENNIVVLDYPTPTPVDASNWPAHVVYGLAARHVHTVISDGHVIVDPDGVRNVDEGEVLADAQLQAKRLWARL